MKMSTYESAAALTVEAGKSSIDGLTLLINRLPAINPKRELCVVQVAMSAERRMHSPAADKDDVIPLIFIVEPNGDAYARN